MEDDKKGKQHETNDGYKFNYYKTKGFEEDDEEEEIAEEVCKGHSEDESEEIIEEVCKVYSEEEEEEIEEEILEDCDDGKKDDDSDSGGGHDHHDDDDEAAVQSDSSYNSTSDDADDKVTVRDSDPSNLVTAGGHEISWTVGFIQFEKADILVSSQGACRDAIIDKAGDEMEEALTFPDIGEITITSGFKLACRYVIHTSCCHWSEDDRERILGSIVQKCLQKAEELRGRSIAFPVIGTGNLNFPCDAASRIMLEKVINFCQVNPFSTLKNIRFVVFQEDPSLIVAFRQEMANLKSSYKSRPVSAQGGSFKPFVHLRPTKSTGRVSVEVLQGDLCHEKTDAIVNVICTDMNMGTAGVLSEWIKWAAGPSVQDELNQLRPQSDGTTVVKTGSGNLRANYIIHLISNSPGKSHLQQCVKNCLCQAEESGIQSISFPAIGTGDFGLSAVDSANMVFQALSNFSTNFNNIQKVRIVILKDYPAILQAFKREQQKYPEFFNVQQKQAVEDLDVDEEGSDSSSEDMVARQPRSGRKAAQSLKAGSASVACTTLTTLKVENDTVSQLSDEQIDTLKMKANDRNVSLEIEANVDRIVVRGEPTEVSGMIEEIWNEIFERTALLFAESIEWSFKMHGEKMTFDQKTNATIEKDYNKGQPTVQISLPSDEFVIDLKAKTGRGRRTGTKITLFRKLKGAEEGIPLPDHWAPMPSSEDTVYTVELAPECPEYQNVVDKVRATSWELDTRIRKIERVQNPHLYQSYMVRKKKMDKVNGRNSELQLFHGTNGRNVIHINTQGFNRSFGGANAIAYGAGVYFARDASYSAEFAYADDEGDGYMYLARVLVGKYCEGDDTLKVPPAKDPSRPEVLYDSVVDDTEDPTIFVVFFDNQCYPEYLITLSQA